MFGIFSKSKKPAAKKKKKSGSKKKKKTVAPAEPVTDSGVETQPETELLDGAVAAASTISSAQEKLDQAKENLAAGNFKSKSSPADRAALIEQALAVHKVQSKLVDDLGEDTKQRLRTIAKEKIFKIQPKN
tara:strand:+ start:1504 stop:1896 length:393 start_codon:yes stop_codon:yes gene_type:complete